MDLNDVFILDINISKQYLYPFTQAITPQGGYLSVDTDIDGSKYYFYLLKWLYTFRDICANDFPNWVY